MRVLLDAGPEQLGGPRLVQLALLIVLEARAASMNVELEWGVLQERVVHKRLSQAAIGTFLKSRSSRQPGEGDFEAWSEIFAGDATLDESWTIGGAQTTALARSHGASSLVHLEDPLDPETSSVCINLVRGPSAGSSLRVNIPAAADAVRLVRDPFGERRAVAAKHSIVLSKTPRLAFSKQRHRLLALTDTGGLVAFHVPGAPGCEPGRPKHVSCPEGETIVAAQVRGRRVSTMSICHGTNELVTRGVFGNRNSEPHRFDSRVEAKDGTVFFEPPKDTDSLCAIDYDFKLGGPGYGSSFPVVVDASGNLFLWDTSYPTRQPECIASNVLAIWPAQARYARQLTNEVVLVESHALVSHERKRNFSGVWHNALAIDASGDGRELRGLCNVSPTELTLVLATSFTHDEVDLRPMQDDERLQIALQPGDIVQGITACDGRYGVVVLDAARTCVYFIVPETRMLLFRLPGEALSTVLSPTGSHFAALTVHGHLQVYSFQREAMVLRDQVGVNP